MKDNLIVIQVVAGSSPVGRPILKPFSSKSYRAFSFLGQGSPWSWCLYFARMGRVMKRMVAVFLGGSN